MIARDFLRRIAAVADDSGCMLALVAATLACAPQGSLGKDLPADGDGSADTAAEGSSTADPTQGTAEGSADGTSTASTGSTGTAGDGSTTLADACAPLPEDDACATCTKDHCCAELSACEASEPCTCIETCIADGGDPTACVESHCGGPNDDWTHLHDCRAEPCLDAC